MTKERLKLFRLLVPGILIFIVLYPFMQVVLQLDGLLEIQTAQAFYVLLVLVLGGIYRTLEARGLLFKDSLNDVHENIKKGLTAPFRMDMDESAKTRLGQVKAKEFMKIFYYFVDRDPSLQAKTQDVYENGLLWSSYADLGVISGISFLIYVVTFFITQDKDFFFWSLALLTVFVISFPLIKLSVKKHKKLSDEQLSYITFHNKDELREKITRLLATPAESQ